MVPTSHIKLATSTTTARQHACSVLRAAADAHRWRGGSTRTGSTLVQHAQQKSGGAISSRPASASCIWAGVSGGVGPSGARQCMHDRHRDLGRDHQPEACWRSRLWSSLMMRSASSFSMLLIVLACDPDCMARRPRKWRRDTTLYAQCTVKSMHGWAHLVAVGHAVKLVSRVNELGTERRRDELRRSRALLGALFGLRRLWTRSDRWSAAEAFAWHGARARGDACGPAARSSWRAMRGARRRGSRRSRRRCRKEQGRTWCAKDTM